MQAVWILVVAAPGKRTEEMSWVFFALLEQRTEEKTGGNKAMNYQKMREEEDERMYQEWKMSQPGYYKNMSFLFLVISLVFVGAMVLIGGLL